ncbi:MAG: VCBS repeat-containing protein, partial [Pirellulales bacterium]|nr:VCBS repeat-containing protein [Pirellulales bacterium]
MFPAPRTALFIAGLLCLPELAQSGEVAFRLHTVDATSTYSAAAAFDVNRDGKLDIVCGGWWYQAPTWKRRFLRDVRVIRGRYDDYAHLPMDVNGDGWTDYVSANWRSQSLYWVEHPGPSLGPWTKHLIASPGGMETARLVDVDGDG